MVGASAGAALTTGDKNAFIGDTAGDSATTATNSVCVGYGTDLSAVDGNQQIVLGYTLIGYGDSTATVGVGSGSDRVYNQFTSNATWTRVSDERYKENIEDNNDCGLAFINDLRPITFTWKSKSDIDHDLPDYDETATKPDYEGKMYGLIAQEVKEVLDKHNITDFGGWSDGKESGIQGISQGMFVYPLIKAIQELSAEVEELKAQPK